MCGIIGFNWDDASLARKMSKRIAHRGPDDSGIFTDKQVSLAHRRLSIVDLSRKGRQPMSDNQGEIHITFNGEIYNFKSIRHELEQKGHRFATETDTEVIIYAYKEWGVKCLERFNGMFAFCIYDAKKKSLFLARDRLGIKPLYYALDSKASRNGEFLFASEIKALLEQVPAAVNKKALPQYFSYRFPVAPQTLFAGITALEPGHYLTFDLKKKKLTKKKYWDINSFSVKRQSAQSHILDVRDTLYDAVEKRMMGDVPVGFFLSGGLDSSIIVGLTRALLCDGQNIKTFSIGFETTNELPYAKQVADHFNTDHQEIHITNNHLKLLDKMVEHADEPIGDPGFFPNFVISQEAKKKVTVVQAGEGADEVFAGYDRYKMGVYGRKIGALLPKIEYKNEILRRLRMQKEASSDKEAYLNVIRAFPEQDLQDLGIGKPKDTEHWPKEATSLQKMQYHDLKTVIPNDFCMKADKMSSAHALEERVPFLDHRVVEIGMRLPNYLKLNGWNEKYILKRAFGSMLPRNILKRRKHGYNVPMDHWFKNDLKEEFEQLLDTRKHNHYDKKHALHLLRNFQSSGTNYTQNFYNAQKLWTLLMFEKWHKRFVE